MLGLRLEETQVYREAKEEGILPGLLQGRQEGQQQEAANLVQRLLRRRLGNLSDAMTNRISNLPLSVLEDLSEALLYFSSLDDLSAWLKAIKFRKKSIKYGFL